MNRYIHPLTNAEMLRSFIGDQMVNDHIEQAMLAVVQEFIADDFDQHRIAEIMAEAAADAFRNLDLNTVRFEPAEEEL